MWATYITWSGLYPPTKSRDEMIEAALKHDTVVGAKVDLVSGVSGRVGLEIVNHYVGEEPCVYFDLVRDGDPLFEICAAARKPLMCHTDLSTSAHNAEQILTMAKRHSTVSVITCHIGLGLMYTHFAPASHLKELLKAKDSKNVYVETSMYSFMWGGQIEGLAEELGSDRMLFGTDSPGKCAASWITRIQNAEMDEEHKKNIFHKTAEGLFPLPSV
jgi:predicted TIM-barrel fold metal-dependent hydrolase